MLVEAALALSATPGIRLVFNDLDESTFRHKLDRDLTSFVRAAPLNGLAEEALRRSFSVIEQGVRLDLLSSAMKVSPQQLPDLHSSLLEACRVLDLDRPPDLFVQSSPQANAYTLALRGRTTAPIVVVTSALLDRCTEPELQAIIGHELGHLKCEHSLHLTLGGLALTPLRNLPFFGASTAESLLEQWRLAAEYTCDRAAMLVAQDVSVVAGAMLKLFAGTRKATSTDAFVAQCLEYDALLKSANPLVRASIQMQQRTHPLPVRRVAELERWAKSDDYAMLLKTGTPLVRPTSVITES
jgi:Zn-dependent protease with chaperone function